MCQKEQKIAERFTKLFLVKLYKRNIRFICNLYVGKARDKLLFLIEVVYLGVLRVRSERRYTLCDSCTEVSTLKLVGNFAGKIQKFFGNTVQRLDITFHDGREMLPELHVVILLIKKFNEDFDGYERIFNLMRHAPNHFIQEIEPVSPTSLFIELFLGGKIL